VSISPGIGQPYTLHVAQDVLDDLRDRLARTRLPREQAGADWATGTPLGYAARLRDYWLDAFDWRAWEARINALDNRTIEIDGITLHFAVIPGSGPAPRPLLLTNGWPGSFLELIDVAERLAHPERFGGSADEAFTVILPSLPGYGLSPPPAGPVSPERIAGLWAGLMQRLGLGRYHAFGADWGCLVTALLALNHPENLAGVQLTMPGLRPTIDDAAPPLTAEENAWRSGAAARIAPERGYQLVQGTKSQSLAYAHTDSPIALACWIAEKFHGWTVPGEPVDPPFAMDDLVANTMLYWVNGALAPMWLYMFAGGAAPIPAGQRVAPPAAFLFSSRDLMLPAPESWLRRMYDVRRVTHAPEIGHFPGLENPAFLAGEIRAFVRETSES